MFILQKIIYIKNFGRYKYNIVNIKDIYKKAKCNNGWVKFKILPLIRAKLSFQTLAIVGKKFGFKEISNQITVINDIKSCESCKSYKN